MKKKRITKIIMSAILALGMYAALPSKDVKAEGNEVAKLGDFPLNINKNTPSSSEFLSTKGYSYDYDSKTLTLKGINATSNKSVIRFVDYSDTMYTINVVGNDNKIVYNGVEGHPFSCIESNGNLTIKSDAAAGLTLDSTSIGIFVANKLNIEGTTDFSLAVNSETHGIYPMKGVSISNSKLDIKAGEYARGITIYEFDKYDINIVNSKLDIVAGFPIQCSGNLNLQSNSKIKLNGERELYNVIKVGETLSIDGSSSLTAIHETIKTGVLCNVKKLNMSLHSNFNIKGLKGTTAITSEEMFDLDETMITAKPDGYNIPNIQYNGVYNIGKAGDTKKFAYEVTIGDATIPEVPSDIPSINKDTQHAWNKALGKGLSFKIEGTYTEIKGVEVDKETVEATSYDTDKEASTLTLKKDYLDTLPTGSHEVAILVDDKRVETTFTIDKADEKADTNGDNLSNKDTSTTTNNNPSNTVDNINNKQNSPSTNTSNIRLIGIMMILVGSVLGWVVLRKKALKN